MAKQLILTADDYGACDFIDNGIIQALEKGIVNSVSAFVTYKDSEQRINRLMKLKKDKNLDFEIGLHFSITAGSPLTLAKTMKKKAGVTEIFKEVHEHDYKQISPAELDVELIAQYTKLSNIMKNNPDLPALTVDHITHHHGVVYFFEHLFEPYVNTVSNLKVSAIRSPMPWHKTDLNFMPLDNPGFLGKRSLPITKDGLETGVKTIINNIYSHDLGNGELRKIIRAQKEKVIKRIFMPIADKKRIGYPFCYADTIYGQRTPNYLLTLLKAIKDHPSDSLIVEFMLHLGDTKVDASKVTDVPVGINKGYFQGRQSELNALLGVDDWSKQLSKFSVSKTNFSKIKIG